MNLAWQSKLVLLLVVPGAAALVVLETPWWAKHSPPFAIWTIGLSTLLGLVAFKVRSATVAAAATGAVITASLMESTAIVPYEPWRTALIPVLALLVITSLATRLGRAKKERLGLAEDRQGRTAAQVAANLGISALACSEVAQSWLADSGWFSPAQIARGILLAPMLAALAEAAADTLSSEIGQVFGCRPRMITTLRQVEPGTDGAITLPGTLAGMAGAAIVAGVGIIALRGDLTLFAICCVGGVFGLFFDSLLGATLEQRGWLNNDLVNFLSTASAAAFAICAIYLHSHPLTR
ncbi:MAG TPA: DUF92 domain-containing protein [Terracidiphilus sp.]|nr:DUF92 domain-containing protein [Terracidiphilus sp.]